MLINLELKVVTRWMGDQRSDEQVRRFRYTPSREVAIDFADWGNTVAKGAKDLGITWDKHGIKFQEGFTPPEIKLFKRTFNRTQKEDFESIPSGTVIKTKIVIDEEKNPDVTKDDVINIFNHIGEFYGLSPWGVKFNYGRFKVEDGYTQINLE
jgi:hypothetical protein